MSSPHLYNNLIFTLELQLTVLTEQSQHGADWCKENYIWLWNQVCILYFTFVILHLLIHHYRLIFTLRQFMTHFYSDSATSQKDEWRESNIWHLVALWLPYQTQVPEYPIQRLETKIYREINPEGGWKFTFSPVSL